MPSLPTMHPRKGFGSKYSIRVKQALLGGRRLDTSTLVHTFPEYLEDDMDIELINRENILSSSYQVERTYFIKVITKRHLKAHRLLTRWRNIVFRMSRITPPFTSFDSALDMAEYEYNAAKCVRDNNGSIATPYAYSQLHGSQNTAAILYEYIPNSGKFEQEDKTLKAFEHLVRSVRELHNGGYTHTSIPFHVVKSVPEGEPYLSDPVGRTKDTDQARLIGVGFDIATLLARYTPHVGTLPALKTLGEYYSDVELIAAYKTSTPIQVTVPGTPAWVINHIRSSIDEYVEPDAVDTYLDVMGSSHEPAPEHATDLTSEETPYSTKEFIQAAVDGPNNTNEPIDMDVDESTHTTPVMEDIEDEELRVGDFKTSDPMGVTDPDAVTSYHDKEPEANANDLRAPGEEPEETPNNELEPAPSENHPQLGPGEQPDKSRTGVLGRMASFFSSADDEESTSSPEHREQ